jgi:hypothetical protein
LVYPPARRRDWRVGVTGKIWQETGHGWISITINQNDDSVFTGVFPFLWRTGRR